MYLKVNSPEEKEAVIRLVMRMGYKFCWSYDPDDACRRYKDENFLIRTNRRSLGLYGCKYPQGEEALFSDGEVPLSFFSYLNNVSWE